MKIYSALYNDWHPIDVFFPEAETCCVRSVEQLDSPGILIIHGGEDISPSLYNHQLSPRTQAYAAPSKRDLIEAELIKAAQARGDVLVFGICRGAQLMCALAGGYLYQDVEGHYGTHPVTTVDDDIILVNSIHHQMCVPDGTKHDLLAYSSTPLSKHYDVGGVMVDHGAKPKKETEAVYYHGMGLAFQWHPEMMSAGCAANQWVLKQINKVKDAYF